MSTALLGPESSFPCYFPKVLSITHAQCSSSAESMTGIEAAKRDTVANERDHLLNLRSLFAGRDGLCHRMRIQMSVIQMRQDVDDNGDLFERIAWAIQHLRRHLIRHTFSDYHSVQSERNSSFVEMRAFCSMAPSTARGRRGQYRFGGTNIIFAHT